MPIDPETAKEEESGDDSRKPLPESLRAQLRAARERSKLSQGELGRRLGISNTQVYRIEAGLRGSRLSTVHRWLQECGMGTDYVELDASEPERQALLATAIGELDKTHLEPVLSVILAWPSLTPQVRKAILALISPDEP